MAQKCSVCGEEAVVNDQESDVKVCVECGSVVDDLVLASDPSNVLDTLTYAPLGTLASKVKSNVLERDNRRKLQALLIVSTVCKQNHLTAEMETAAKNMFDRMYEEDERVKFCLTDTKRLYASACVYIVLRQFDFPVTLKEFCLKNRIPLPNVASMNNFIIKKFEIQLPNQSVSSLARGLLQQLGFNSGIISDALQIIDICRQAWLTTGQHRDSIIYVAGYYAYAISKPEYLSLTYKDFCAKFKLNSNYSLFAKLNNVLQEFTNKLPWSHGKGKKNYIILNLRDVLKYQRSLYNTLLHTEPIESVKPIDRATSTESNEEIHGKGIEQKTVTDTSSSNRPCSNSRKRSYVQATGSNTLLPPSFVRVKGAYKRASKNQNYFEKDEEWDGENLTEEQDRKLDEYIRDPKEVEMLGKVKF